MPYTGELANKASHFDIIKNPEVTEFLEDCVYLTPPSDEEARALGEKFKEPELRDDIDFPKKIISIDGSRHESNIDDRLPSTRVGYVKVSSVLIDMTEFDELKVRDRFIDPFRVAKLQRNISPLTFSLPSANVRLKDRASVRDSFRAAVDKALYDNKTRFNEKDPKTSLRSTLFHLASLRPDEKGTANPDCLKIHKCASCGNGPITLRDIPEPQYCPECREEVFPSDCLRLWEEVSEYQSNLGQITRFMNVVEHLLPIHYIRYLSEQFLAMLGTTAFFCDGPLFISGPSAWLHASIMRFLANINTRLHQQNLPTILIIGLQKTGQIVDHVKLIERFVPSNRLLAIEDDYRYKYILSGRSPNPQGFGYETYYGQDFIYKTPSGRTFVFALPYKPGSKREPDFVTFKRNKASIGQYSELSQALALINHFESDLYENAVIPIALAHRYTAISLVPGGKVLDLLTKKAFASKG